MSSPPRDEPADDNRPKRADDITLSDQDRRILGMLADVLRLGSQRPDLSSAQRSELYHTGRGWLSKHMARGVEPSTEAVFAWIDTFVPPEGRPPDEDHSPEEAGHLSGPIDDHPPSLFDLDSLSMAEPLRVLAGRRTDLSEAQRSELYRAARSRLARRVRGRIVQPTRNIVFAWIDAVVPVRASAQSDLASAGPEAAGASPMPDDASASLGQRPKPVESPVPHQSRRLRPPLLAGRAIPQSLDAQEPGGPDAPAPPRRARGLPDPRAAFDRALVEAVLVGESRLSKTAISTRMGIDRKTLSRYIEDGLIPSPPWESLATDLSGAPRPQ